MAAECAHDLHDAAGREQAPDGMGCRPVEPTAVAGVDRQHGGMGAASDEHRAVGAVCTQSPEVAHDLTRPHGHHLKAKHERITGIR